MENRCPVVNAMTDKQNSIAILESTHNFPCEFMFKVIGKNSDQLLIEINNVFQQVLAIPNVEPAIRETPGGRHISVTITQVVKSAEVVLDVYARLRQIDGVVMLI